MKLQSGILDSHTLYKTRLSNYFAAHYADKAEILSFTDPEMMLA